MSDFLYLIDLQDDFISGSLKALGAKDETYIESICDEIDAKIDAKKKGDPKIQKYSKIYVTHDWHPPYHCSFNAFPQHCVQNTKGADIYGTIFTKLQSFDSTYKKHVSNKTGQVVNLYKGFDQTCDTYAAARTPAKGRKQEYAPDNETLALENYVNFYKSLSNEDRKKLTIKNGIENTGENININGKLLEPATLMLKPYKIATENTLTEELLEEELLEEELLEYVNFYKSLDKKEDREKLQIKTSENKKTALDNTNINGKLLEPATLMLKPYKLSKCEPGTETKTGSALKNKPEQELIKFGEDDVTQFKIEEQSPNSITILGLCTDFCAANTALNMMANFKDNNNTKTKIIFRSDLSRPIGFPNNMANKLLQNRDNVKMENKENTDSKMHSHLQHLQVKVVSTFNIEFYSCNARMIVYYMMMYLIGIDVKASNDQTLGITFNNTSFTFDNVYIINDVMIGKGTPIFAIEKLTIHNVNKKDFYMLELNDEKQYSLLDIFENEGGFNLHVNHIAPEHKKLWDHLNYLKDLKGNQGGGKRKRMNKKTHNHGHNRPPSNFFLLPGSKARRQKPNTKSKTTTSKKTSSGLGDYEKMGVSTFMHKSKKRTQMLYKKKKNGKTYFRMKDDKTGVMKYVLLK